MQGRVYPWIYALILGGAAGNLMDRAIRGYVVDFIDLPWFATSNIADVAISVAVILIIFLSLQDIRKERKEQKEG